MATTTGTTGGFRSRKPSHESVVNGASVRLAGGSSSSAATGTKKKLTIKPFTKAPALPAAFEEQTWGTLAAALAAVLRKQPTALSREELYRAVEDMCTWKMAARCVPWAIASRESRRVY